MHNDVVPGEPAVQSLAASETSKPFIASVPLLLTLSGAASWQGPAAELRSAADSAQSAREEWRAAVAADAKDDTAAVLRHLAAAHAAWPTQGAYVRALASYSARAGNASAAAKWLDVYAGLGFGEDLAADAAFSKVSDGEPVRSALRRLADNLRPAGRSDVAFRLTDSTIFAEGLDCTADGPACFLSDLRHRRVLRLQPGGAVDTVAGPEQGLLAPLAVAVDEVRQILWLASVPLPFMDRTGMAVDSQPAVLAIDLRSGKLIRRATFAPDDAVHEPGAILLAADGAIYVSDSRSPAIYQVPDSGASLIPAFTSPLFRSLQGMTESADGNLLYVADYSHGLFAIDRRTGEVTRLSVPPGSTVLGIDGLARHGNTLIGVQNGIRPARVVRLPLDTSGLRITAVEVVDRRPDLATEPTAGDVIGDRFFYVANSHWQWYDDDGSVRSDARLTAPIVLVSELGRPCPGSGTPSQPPQVTD